MNVFSSSSIFRHRIWLQITATWGWVEGSPIVRERKQAKLEKEDKEAAAKKPARKKWAAISGSAQASPTQLSPAQLSPARASPLSSVRAKKAAEAKGKSLGYEPIPVGTWPTLCFLLADHFQWDA